MKIKVVILFIAIFLSISSFSQTKEIDSLRNILMNAKEDTSKVNTLNALCYSMIINFDPESANKIVDSALRLAEQLNYQKGVSDSRFNRGIILRNKSEYENAIAEHLLALKIKEKIGDKEGIAETYYHLGYTHSMNDNPPTALKYFFLSLKNAEDLKDTANIIKLLIEIGRNYEYQEDSASGREQYELALWYADQAKSLSEIDPILSELATASLQLGKLHKAFDFANRSLQLYTKKGDMRNGAFQYVTIGYIYEAEGDSAAATGNTTFSKRKYSLAISNYFQFAKLHPIQDSFASVGMGNLSAIYTDIGNAYIKLGNFDKAKFYFDTSLVFSKKIGWWDNLKNNYDGLYRLAVEKGDHRAAYEYYKQYIVFRDSATNESNLAKMEGARLQYQFHRKEDSLNQKQIITQAKLDSQKKQKSFYLAGAGMLGLLSLFVFLNFRNQKKINKLANDAHAKEKAELELQSLRAQLNPHFMFNSLNAIQELILLEENEKSQSYLARFAKLLRLLLENADKPFIPLQRELDFLQLYLSLENLRIPDLVFSINVDSKINTEATMIPNMILQPYIENANWHGLSPKASDKKLQIRINNEHEVTKYEIEDNGVGRKRSAELKSLYRKEHKSKGMELLSKRFKLLAKEYGSEVETTITDVLTGNETGTIVTIKVPNNIKLNQAP